MFVYMISETSKEQSLYPAVTEPVVRPRFDKLTARKQLCAVSCEVKSVSRSLAAELVH